MGNTILIGEKYFNKRAFLHCAIVLVVFVCTDMSLLIWEQDNFISKSFYSKFAVCLCYMLASKEQSSSEQIRLPLEFTFHFISYMFCVWLAIVNLASTKLEISRIVGFFLFFGTFAMFNILVELMKYNRKQKPHYHLAIPTLEIVAKLLFIKTLISGALFLLVGSWYWFVVPIYEW